LQVIKHKDSSIVSISKISKVIVSFLDVVKLALFNNSFV